MILDVVEPPLRAKLVGRGKEIAEIDEEPVGDDIAARVDMVPDRRAVGFVADGVVPGAVILPWL
jgi:hypothetical protein